MLPPKTNLVTGVDALDAWVTAKQVTDKVIKPACTFCKRITGYVVGTADTLEERRFWTGLFNVAGWNYFMIQNQIFIQITPCHVHAGLFDGRDGKPCQDGGYDPAEASEYRHYYDIGKIERQEKMQKKAVTPVEKRKNEMALLGL